MGTHSTCASARAQLYQPTDASLPMPLTQCVRTTCSRSSACARDVPFLTRWLWTGSAGYETTLRYRAVRCEDLAAEERIMITIERLTILSRRMGILLRKREAPAPISTPATAVIMSLLYTML